MALWPVSHPDFFSHIFVKLIAIDRLKASMKYIDQGGSNDRQ